jgi:hypothetical protein
MNKIKQQSGEKKCVKKNWTVFSNFN